jgi:hypothetical protein
VVVAPVSVRRPAPAAGAGDTAVAGARWGTLISQFWALPLALRLRWVRLRD